MVSQSPTRIIGEPAEIEFESVRSFFEERGRKFDSSHPYVSVLYQDHDAALAEARDAYEKRLITAQLRLHSTSRVLDIGCGVGRWADAVAAGVARYVGMDYSANLIGQARARAPKGSEFHVLAATELGLAALGQSEPFDRVIIAGLLLYLNDADVRKMFGSLPAVCGDRCRIYLREPLAVGKRLTLRRHWSSELSAEYSAIYRSRDELANMMATELEPHSFRATRLVELFGDSSLNNRTETSQFYCFLDRGDP